MTQYLYPNPSVPSVMPLDQPCGWLPCLSGEEHSGAFQGRLITYVAGRDWTPEVRSMLCGSAGMVSEVRDIPVGKGVLLEKIVSEIHL